MACQLDGTKPLSYSILEYCLLDPCDQISVKFSSKIKYFIQENTVGAIYIRSMTVLKSQQNSNGGIMSFNLRMHITWFL